jgi:hypothetical protein
MLSHQERAEYKLSLEAFAAIEKELAIAKADPLRKPMVERIEELAREARTVLEFQKIEMKITGVLIAGSQACALINGKTLFIGDMLGDEILVRDHQGRRDRVHLPGRDLRPAILTRRILARALERST